MYLTERERSIWKKKRAEISAQKKKENSVCVLECVYTKSGGSSQRRYQLQHQCPGSRHLRQHPASTTLPSYLIQAILLPPHQPIHLQNRCRSAHTVQMCDLCAVIDRKNLAMDTPQGSGIRTAQGVYSDGVISFFFFKVLMCMSVGEELFRLQAKQLSMVIRGLYRGRNQLHHSFLLFMLFILH